MVDKLDEYARAEHGVTLLGMPWFSTAHVWLTKPVKTLADLRSMKIRSHPSYDPVLKPLGVPTVSVSFSEIYTALDRGVIDGAVLSDLNLTVYGIEPIVRYRLDPPFWRAGWAPFFITLEAFNALPKDLQDLLVNTMIEVETEAPAMYDRLAKEEWARLKAAGVQPTRLSDAEWLQSQQIAWEEGLPQVLEQITPDHAQELRDMMSQFYPPKEPYPVAGQ